MPLTPVAVNGGPLPPNAVQAGNETDLTVNGPTYPLYICRAPFQGGLHPGKIRSGWTACHISWGGTEHAISTYDVLVPTFTFVATVKLWCLAISSPRSHVNERLREAGSLRICRLSAATTVAVSLLGTLTRMVKRECLSTRVAI